MNKKNCLVFGKGGREDAIVDKLMKSPQAGVVYVAPGNPGMAMRGCQTIPIAPVGANFEILASLVRSLDIDLIVIQLDDALADGLSDYLRSTTDAAVFGPSQAAARIEWSKAFSKVLMRNVGIPTAPFEIFSTGQEIAAQDYVRQKDGRVVVKADGLALGKGAVVCHDVESALKAMDDCLVHEKFKKAGEIIVIEDLLEGTELSLHVLSDGHNIVMFPPVRDHKHLLAGNKGPMTGGMGVYGPIDIDQMLLDTIRDTIVIPCIQELHDRDTPFRGLLYPGLMLTATGPKVLEFNARFGDPETQVYMPLLGDDVDLIDVFEACGEKRLDRIKLSWKPNKAVCIVGAAEGYPEKPRIGDEIFLQGNGTGGSSSTIFHAGTKWENGKLVTSGGRVLSVTTLLPDGAEIAEAYKPFTRVKVHFRGMQYRNDIGTAP